MNILSMFLNVFITIKKKQLKKYHNKNYIIQNIYEN